MADSTISDEQQRHSRLVLYQVSLGLAVVAINHRAIQVALPTLTHVFHSDLSFIQWVLLVYDLCVIGLVLTLGRLGDLFGRKWIYISGFLIFVLGSLFCGLAQSSTQLILFRVLQGIGGAMIMANGRALVTVNSPASERGKALGFTSMAFHVGYITGPTLGGFIIDAVGWRWVFFLTVPIGLVCAYFGWKILNERTVSEGQVQAGFRRRRLSAADQHLFPLCAQPATSPGFRRYSGGDLFLRRRRDAVPVHSHRAKSNHADSEFIACSATGCSPQPI